MINHSIERFTEVAPEMTCHGFNFFMTVDDVVFKVRHYDNLPGVATVIEPKESNQLSQAKSVVHYLTSVLGREMVLFYDGTSDTYREVDLETLEFKTDDKCPAKSRFETKFNLDRSFPVNGFHFLSA